jgi:flagellar L-ring protein precursor FlgH
MLKKILCFLLICAVGSAASLWKDDTESPILRKNKFKVGDTITVVVDESLNAAQSGSTQSDKASNVGLDATNRATTLYQPYGRGTQSTTGAFRGSNNDQLNFSTGGKNSFSGSGKTTRETAIKSTITATIIDVQPNGKVFILGQRQIKVNNESEILEVSGIVSVENISDSNTVFSTQLANAKITIKGAGVVSSQQSPGVMSKMFEWLF